MKRLPLITSFILFIALCTSAAYWAMQIFKPPVRAIAAPPQAVRPAPPLAGAAGVFGGRTSFTVASNYQLKGVIAAAKQSESVAILAVNGKPAQAVRVNREVIPGVTLQEVQQDHVLLSENGVIKRVDLPADTKRGGVIATPSTARMDSASANSAPRPPQQQNSVRNEAHQRIKQSTPAAVETSRLMEEYRRKAVENPADAAQLKKEYLDRLRKQP